MTRFLLSHNPQVACDDLPALSAVDLAAGLAAQTSAEVEIQALSHPHWLIQVDADLAPAALAEIVLRAWRRFRCPESAALGDYQLLALGGRKDGAAAAGAALQQGSWGVDVVETLDVKAFLRSINWEMLKQGRPADAVFEILG